MARAQSVHTRYRSRIVLGSERARRTQRNEAFSHRWWGIPLALMEAMARGKIVLAPSITGIPESVEAGKTGFLYAAGDLEQFVWQVEQICKCLSALGSIGRAAREHILQNFDQHKNLAKFADVFMQRIAHGDRSHADENFVLQQI